MSRLGHVLQHVIKLANIWRMFKEWRIGGGGGGEGWGMKVEGGRGITHLPPAFEWKQPGPATFWVNRGRKRRGEGVIRTKIH